MTDNCNLCFLRISVAGCPPETVLIELYTKECPKTCHNFAALCASTETTSRLHPKPTYRGTEFHRIIPKFIVQGGDFENFNGSGGYCAKGGTFADESFCLSHDQEGIVSMANRGPNTNGSQFFITLAPSKHLDRKHVAFGKVVKGMSTIRKMERVETENDKPVAMQRIIVMDCGIGSGKQETSSGSSQRDDKKDKKNKKDREKHRKKRSRSDDSDSASFERRKHRKKRRRHDHNSDSSSKRKHGKHRKRHNSEKRKKDRKPSKEPQSDHGEDDESKAHRLCCKPT